MSLLKNVRVNISVDRLIMDCSTRTEEWMFNKREVIGNYRLKKSIPLSKSTNRWKDIIIRHKCRKYKYLLQYKNLGTGNDLFICMNRKNRKVEWHLVPCAMLYFGSSITNPLEYEDVYQVVKSIEKKGNIGLRPSEIDLAIDFINDKNIDLHKRICRSIKAGKKRPPKIIGTSLYFGSPTSSNQIVVYDKGLQLKEMKNYHIQNDISRVEVRMDIHRMNNFITSFNEVGSYNWTFLHRKYLSFHHPTDKLKKIINKKDAHLPVWKLKSILNDRYQIKSSNFYRDYIRDHRWFAPAIRAALSSYRWNSNQRKL